MVWNDIKVNVPGVGERAYVIERLTDPGCLHYPGMDFSCSYLHPEAFSSTQSTTSGSLGSTSNIGSKVYPDLGDYISFLYAPIQNPSYPLNVHCYKVIDITCILLYLEGLFSLIFRVPTVPESRQISFT